MVFQRLLTTHTAGFLVMKRRLNGKSKKIMKLNNIIDLKYTDT